MALLARLRRALGGTSHAGGAGEGTGRLGPWARDDHGPGTKDVHALDVERDPRGGVQSSAYRHADPRELVVVDDVAMMGPAGAPVGEVEDEAEAQGRRRESRSDDGGAPRQAEESP